MPSIINSRPVRSLLGQPPCTTGLVDHHRVLFGAHRTSPHRLGVATLQSKNQARALKVLEILD
jgi:hypothetical protein